MDVQDAFAAPRSTVRDVSGGTGLMTDSIVQSLRKTRPWVLFLSILGFIGTAFIVIAAIFMMVGAGAMPAEAGLPAGNALIGVGVLYLIMGVIYFFLSFYLLRYASGIKRAVASLATSDLESALSQQANFWKLAGIMTLVMIVLSIGMVVLMPAMMMGM